MVQPNGHRIYDVRGPYDAGGCIYDAWGPYNALRPYNPLAPGVIPCLGVIYTMLRAHIYDNQGPYHALGLGS